MHTRICPNTLQGLPESHEAYHHTTQEEATRYSTLRTPASKHGKVTLGAQLFDIAMAFIDQEQKFYFFDSSKGLLPRCTYPGSPGLCREGLSADAMHIAHVHAHSFDSHPAFIHCLSNTYKGFTLNHGLHSQPAIARTSRLAHPLTPVKHGCLSSNLLCNPTINSVPPYRQRVAAALAFITISVYQVIRL